MERLLQMVIPIFNPWHEFVFDLELKKNYNGKNWFDQKHSMSPSPDWLRCAITQNVGKDNINNEKEKMNVSREKITKNFFSINPFSIINYNWASMSQCTHSVFLFFWCSERGLDLFSHFFLLSFILFFLRLIILNVWIKKWDHQGHQEYVQTEKKHVFDENSLLLPVPSHPEYGTQGSWRFLSSSSPKMDLKHISFLHALKFLDFKL